MKHSIQKRLHHSGRNILTVLILFSHALFLTGISAQDEPVVSGEMGMQLDDYMTRLEGVGFSGAVIVVIEGNILLRKGYGLADRELNRPVLPSTVFTIGSITKQFTGAAILKLEMMGRLTTNDLITSTAP